MSTPIVFAPGTVVKAVAGSRLSKMTPWKDDLYVVTKIAVSSGGIEYSVEGSAWYHPLDLIYVSEPTYETLAHVINSEEDGDADDDDYEDEEEIDCDDDSVSETKPASSSGKWTAANVEHVLTVRETGDESW